MLIRLNAIRGYHMHATDGSLGKASDIFFDDHGWTVRYLVVDTGWLFGHKVLLAPESIDRVDVENEEVFVSLTKQQIDESPEIESDLPVSRQKEIATRDWYGWPYYWDTYTAGVTVAPLIPPVHRHEAAPPPAAAADAARAAEQQGSPDLRSAREVEGYHIHATDDRIGHVDDFIIDTADWSIRYIVVDTGNWLPGRRVLIAPRWAEGINWHDRELWVKLDREAVKNSPPYEPESWVDRDYEARLHDYYRYPPYWL
ncbi:MAG: PRC-barrel domain-containing protein [Azospirillaceae bacterium]